MLRTQIQEIAKQASELYDRAERGDLITARDVAVAVELNQRYCEFLEKAEEQVSVSSRVVCRVGGQVLSFKNENDFSNWLAEIIK